jgi:hypothetical protein
MERYKQFFAEEMLDGFIKTHVDEEKFMVYRIESYKEFKKMGYFGKGVIINGQLYMTVGFAYVIHQDILKYLKNVQKISIPSGIFSSEYFLENIDKFLLVQTDNSMHVKLAESYPDINLLIEEEIRDVVKKHFKVLDRLHIPYKYEVM